MQLFKQFLAQCRNIGWRKWLQSLLNRKMTFMIVPHSSFKPVHLQFTVAFTLFVLTFWTGITSWATWAVMSNVDYWSMRVNHQVLKLKVQYFAQELRKSREVLEQVQEADTQLRQLLGMHSRKTIIEGEEGKGGPEVFDQAILSKTLTQKLWNISDEEIRRASDSVYKESVERLASYKEISEYIAHERGLFRSTPRGWPAEGRITSQFGQRVSPMHGGPQFHTGVDIANQHGTPIYATADGIVKLADWEGGYGRLVVVEHGFGYTTFYGHNSEVAVKPGQKVRRGQLLSYMGSSGSSTGDHVHYEVWYQGRYLNPWKFMMARSVQELVPTRQQKISTIASPETISEPDEESSSQDSSIE